MTQPPKPQTKFNAKRSAENATRRTGIEHSIAEVEGGWMVVAPSATTNEPVATGIDEAIQAEASAIADEIDAGQVKPPGSLPRDRVRQVGPNKEGAKGSYSIYRIVG